MNTTPPPTWRKDPLETWGWYAERHQLKLFGIGFLLAAIFG